MAGCNNRQSKKKEQQYVFSYLHTVQINIFLISISKHDVTCQDTIIEYQQQMTISPSKVQ